MEYGIDSSYTVVESTIYTHPIFQAHQLAVIMTILNWGLNFIILLYTAAQISPKPNCYEKVAVMHVNSIH